MSEPRAGGAIFSPCRRYRYNLWRRWEADNHTCALWVMLNPSTADENADDPTIRRCIAFSRAWGCGQCEIVNLYGYRGTDPHDLRSADDPVGPDNDANIQAALARSHTTICAWGGKYLSRQRPDRVLEIIRDSGATPRCLKRLQNGDPGHPLYLRGDLRPEVLEPARDSGPRI